MRKPITVRSYTGEHRLTPTQKTALVWTVDLAVKDVEAKREREWQDAYMCEGARFMVTTAQKLEALGLIEMRFKPVWLSVQVRATDAGIAATTASTF